MGHGGWRDKMDGEKSVPFFFFCFFFFGLLRVGMMLLGYLEQARIFEKGNLRIAV